MSDKMLKVFNLTDISTPKLEQFKLVDQHVVVGRSLLAPGESAEVPDDTITRAGLQHYVEVGAVAVGSVPPSYAVAKDRALSEKRAAEKKADDGSNPGKVFGGKKKDS